MKCFESGQLLVLTQALTIANVHRTHNEVKWKSHVNNPQYLKYSTVTYDRSWNIGAAVLTSLTMHFLTGIPKVTPSKHVDFQW